jgi:hypothetical protein
MTQVAAPDTVVANFDGQEVDAVEGRPMRLERLGDQFWADFDDPDRPATSRLFDQGATMGAARIGVPDTAKHVVSRGWALGECLYSLPHYSRHFARDSDG